MIYIITMFYKLLLFISLLESVSSFFLISIPPPVDVIPERFSLNTFPPTSPAIIKQFEPNIDSLNKKYCINPDLNKETVIDNNDDAFSKKYSLNIEDTTIILNALHYYKKVEKKGTFQKYDSIRINQVRDKITQQLTNY